MRLSQLEYFVKIVECGSFTRAAQELYLSQPSLTKAVSALETEFDVKLFSRNAKGIRLTSQGREFLEYAKSIIEDCNALERSFGKDSKPQIPRVTIASQQFSFLYDLLIRLYQENQGQPFQIDLKEDDRGGIVKRVENNTADIGLLVLSDSDIKMFRNELKNKKLDIHTLDRSSVYVSMGPNSPLYGKETVEMEDAENQLSVMLDIEQSMRRELRHTKTNEGINQKNIIFCNTIAACQRILEETDALLFTPKWVPAMFHGTKIRTVRVTTDGMPYPDVSRLVWIKRAGEPLEAHEERFLTLLKGCFSHETEFDSSNYFSVL